MQHVHVIMAMLWKKRVTDYLKDRFALIDTCFTTLLLEIDRDPSTLNWGLNLKSFVTRKSTEGIKTEFLKKC